MFNKLISNLAISPSTIDQVSFYARRLRREESIRRTGFALIILSMFIQIFAASVPPEQSLAASNNDVINGGVKSIADLKKKFNNQADVRELYNRFGIEGKDITESSINKQSFNFQRQGERGTRTVGRVNFASTKDHNLGSFAGTTFYSRSAGEWQGTTEAYYFGRQKGTDGKYYLVWVLKDCGNIAYRAENLQGTVEGPPSTGIPITPAPKPTPIPPAPQPRIPEQPNPAPPTPKPVCENNPALPADSELCKCVDNPEITADNPACTTPKAAKEARNITQKLNPQQTTASKARPGDTIEYTLVATNTNIVPKTKYVIEDYIGDVLDYANLDQGHLNNQGGVFDPKTRVIRWDNQTIPANGQLKRTFKVTLKDVIPSTNTPNATATDFDCKMQNGFGNEVVIMVECPVLKQVETLPNTGPGETIAAGFGISVVSGYFFMRSRLLRKEVGIIKKTYQAGY